jgi:hypothetical protein
MVRNNKKSRHVMEALTEIDSQVISTGSRHVLKFCDGKHLKNTAKAWNTFSKEILTIAQENPIKRI